MGLLLPSIVMSFLLSSFAYGQSPDGECVVEKTKVRQVSQHRDGLEWQVSRLAHQLANVQQENAKLKAELKAAVVQNTKEKKPDNANP